MATINRKEIRDRVHTRIRKRVSGTASRPRLSVHFSAKHIYVQLIDDIGGKTIASACTTEKEIRAGQNVGANVVTAQRIGTLIAERGTTKQVKKIVFDRGGYIYHGKVKALADAARQGGLEF